MQSATGPRHSIVISGNPVLSHSLKSALAGSELPYDVVAEPAGLPQTLQAVRKHAPRLLIACDDSLDPYLLKSLRLESPRTRVVIISNVLTNERTSTLDEVADLCVQGGSWPEFLESLKQVVEVAGELTYQEGNGALTVRADEGGEDPLKGLSKREREVFQLLAEGIPNRIIAKKLFVSPRTVETHRARVIRKLGVISTAGLIRYAIKHNLVTL